PTNRVYETTINKVIKSASKVDHYKLNKNDFSIVDIEANEIIEMAKGLLDA
ncbi:MAG: lipopolysaccharide heptosyltransferase I, partial [Sulfurovum sp.]|nr:lipopolysaccharide heptosyltransferase I [Sulfurovum sp.]